MLEEKHSGLLISRHTIKDKKSKAAADDLLYNWEYTRLTGKDWITQLEQGNIIILGEFTPNGKGKYTHAEQYWKSTHFIFADGDYLKGVDLYEEDVIDPDGNIRHKAGDDINPNGLPPWTEDGQLSIKYPQLLDEVYAVTESVNSMSPEKPPPHRRYRLIFMFDQPIICGMHYRQILSTLAERYPIISTDERQPAQPVYGNARKGHNKPYINGKVLKLSDFPYIEPEPVTAAKPKAKPEAERKPTNDEQGITLQEFLDKHKVPYTLDDKSDPRYPNRFFVKCPHANKHTNKTGEKDSFVWDDGNGFAFSCSHTSCGDSSWKQFTTGYGIKTSPGGYRKGAGRKSNAEKASEFEMPIELSGKPVVFLHEVEEIDGKPVISERPREVVSEEIGKHLWESNRIFIRGDEIGMLRKGENGLFFKPLDTAGLQGEVSRCVSLMKIINGEPTGVANPHKWIAEDLLNNQTVKNGRHVKVVVSHPFWNGKEIIFTKGYDPNTQTYLDCEKRYMLDTEKHTAAADLQIWKDLLCDFPFRDESDFENAMAYVITLIIRQGLSTGETVPLVDITAPREGVGKSLLADVLTAAILGRAPITRSLSDKRDETEKAIAAALRSAPESVIFDNVDNNKPLDCATLASVITQPNRAFRILGVSQETFYENRATILYTGSNVEATPELVKRTIAIRLADPGIAEKDRKVKVDGLLSHTIKHHEELLSSALRMVQRWIDSGSKEETETLHRMRQWSRVIKGIMTANSFGNHFMQNYNEVMLQANPEFTAWSNAFKAIVNELGDKAFDGWTASDVFEILSHTDNVYAHEDDIHRAVANGQRNYTRISRGHGILDELIGTSGAEHSRKVKLGRLLRKKTGSVNSGFKLVDTHKSDRTGKKIYKLEKHEKTPDPTPNTDTELEDGDFQPLYISTEVRSDGSRPDDRSVPAREAKSEMPTLDPIDKQLDRFLNYIDGVPIHDLSADTAAEILGIHPERIKDKIKSLMDGNIIYKSIHDGEERFFVK